MNPQNQCSSQGEAQPRP